MKEGKQVKASIAEAGEIETACEAVRTYFSHYRVVLSEIDLLEIMTVADPCRTDKTLEAGLVEVEMRLLVK